MASLKKENHKLKKDLEEAATASMRAFLSMDSSTLAPQVCDVREENRERERERERNEERERKRKSEREKGTERHTERERERKRAREETREQREKQCACDVRETK